MKDYLRCKNDWNSSDTEKMMHNINHSNSPITLKINIQDKGIYEKRFTFNSKENVWAAKEQIIHEIGKDLKDIQNYGLFVPPHQGKAGKFMDEGRPLSEYSIPGNDQVLEFMLKRRIYRSISFDENKLTKIHTKSNLKKLMELIEQNNAGQVHQFLEKGLDPNFIDPKTGETPLTAAAMKNNANEVIMFLVNGGAYFDFRNRSGLTAVHKSAIIGNSHNIKAFLDLGASTDYRDFKGLTPLYHACLSGKNPNVAELLLGDQADIGVVDSQGWQEIHQVCRYGHVKHLEQLIFYGADLNAQNGSGNTPLHICCLYNQEDCARLLLYRAARRDVLNFANQTPEMVAVVAKNTMLSVFIRNYNESDVVPYIDKPTYSTRRRTQSKSRPSANSVFVRDSTDTFIFCSESLSNTSSTPSIHSENSEPMSLDLSPRDIVPQVNITEAKESPSRKLRRKRTLSGSGSDSSYASDSGDDGGAENLTTPVKSPNADELNIKWRTYSLSSLNKEERGNIPRVKEVKGAANMGPTPAKSNSRKTYVAVRAFTPTQAGELSLLEGDLVEVLTKGEKGYWQGSVAGKTGWFPADFVEDLKKRKNNKIKNALHKPASIASSLNRSNTSLDQAPYVPPVVTTPQPRQVILNKVKAGFGFQMRGANVPAVNKLEFQPSAKIPALQYVGDVEPGGEADKRGVKKGDYILEVNGNDVKTASHRHVVSLIRKTGQSLVMKLISLDNGEHFLKTTSGTSSSTTSGSPTAEQEKRTSVIVNGNGHIDGAADKKPPPVPSRAPTTSLSNRPKPVRTPIADVDFEVAPVVQEDRVISVPRERISPTDQQWRSPLSGYSSLPRRPKSSYGAIIASPHASPSDETTPPNFRPVKYVDNTGFTTLPSKPDNARHVTSQDDTAIRRRRSGSARLSRDRPKSWMPKVLPTEPPPISPPTPQEKPQSNQSEISRTDSKRDKKKRFSFRKKKEKDYVTGSATQPTKPETENEDENVSPNDVSENLHIEDEENRPNSLPGHHKRLSTFKPVSIPHKQIVHTDAVSPELSQALQKRKSRSFSSGTDDTVFPAVSPENEHPVPVFPPPPSQSPPNPPKAKSLEESIREEMMRRKCNTAPVSSIPTKPRRTFEYKKGDSLSGEDEVLDEQGALESELAKAVAKRAAKITATPKSDTHIYENVQYLNINASREPRSSVEEPPILSIEEKLKKLNLEGEVILPTKFKPPVAPPSAKGTKVKPPVNPNEKPASPEASSQVKVPPKTFPKPKRMTPSNSSTSDSETMDMKATSRPVTLPIVSSQPAALPPPPILSPEMVATQLLDDVIDEEVKRSNWDTASWKDKNLSSGKTSPTFVGETAKTKGETVMKNVDNSPTSGLPSPSVKKKYIYKITMVTETQADGSEQTKTVTQVITQDSQPGRVASPASSELPPPPAPPPLQFLDESPMPAPMFTPPTSPCSEIPDLADFTPPPPLSYSPPPPPIVEGDVSSSQKSIEMPVQPQVPPLLAFQEREAPQGNPLLVEISPEPISTPSGQPSSEASQYTSPVPAPVINVNAQNQCPPLTSATLTPPGEFKENKPEEFSPEKIVVPPPIFADTTDGSSSPVQPTNNTAVSDSGDSSSSKKMSLLERMQARLNKKEESKMVVEQTSNVSSRDETETESVETHPKGGSEGTNAQKNENPVSDKSSHQVTSESEIVAEKTSTATLQAQTETTNVESHPEGKGEAESNEKPEGLEEESQTKMTSEGSVISQGEATTVLPLTCEQSSSPDASGRQVQAPPESKDQNENVLEAPTVYAGNKEEQAPSKPFESDASTDISSFRDIPYDDWTCANVCDWLVSIGMGEHGHLFQENDIRGPNLLELSKDDLRELGVKKLGHRMTITNEVSRLTTNNGAATNL